MPIPFIKDFDPSYGHAVTLTPEITRITARNASALTFTGTNSYLIGTDTLAIIDPGPIDEAHLQNLLHTIGNRSLSHIFVTHSHIDHSQAAYILKEKTGALIVAEGVYRPSHGHTTDKLHTPNNHIDINFKPDHYIKDNEVIEGDGWAIKCVTTPGHMSNHASFALNNRDILFSGDHVMSWATTVIAPPDGSMKDYIASLDKLLVRSDRIYLPGHGGPVYKPHHFVRALKSHRIMREKSILEHIKNGDHCIKDIVAAIYVHINPQLQNAASSSVFAHIEYLMERGLVKCSDEIGMNGFYSAS